MTEDEAKTRWCPMYPVGVDLRVTASTNLQYRSNCIGAACMMWRWDHFRKNGEPFNTNGYCGIAGKP